MKRTWSVRRAYSSGVLVYGQVSWEQKSGWMLEFDLRATSADFTFGVAPVSDRSEPESIVLYFWMATLLFRCTGAAFSFLAAPAYSVCGFASSITRELALLEGPRRQDSATRVQWERRTPCIMQKGVFPSIFSRARKWTSLLSKPRMASRH